MALRLVADLSVVIYIEEFSKIIDLHVPPLQETDEIQSQPTSQVNTLAKIEHPTPNEAVIHWAPTLEEQKSINKDGVKGQLIVRYDVDRLAHPEQILINDGYFVHFYAPNDLKTLRKHVTFVLDVSGSMCGRKIEQLKAAMKTILSDLNPDDLLSIIIFSTGIHVWDLEKNYGEGDFIPQPIDISPDLALLENSEALHGSSVIVSASATNIEKAKQHTCETSYGLISLEGEGGDISVFMFGCEDRRFCNKRNSMLSALGTAPKALPWPSFLPVGTGEELSSRLDIYVV
uniref:VWFA domain-containing protein n=1 Tax=Timema poppense TaxID=170557 RepID=A0A7R9CNM7_TIMPO|nr:unnamed protein product [Timema poppensis]